MLVRRRSATFLQTLSRLGVALFLFGVVALTADASTRQVAATGPSPMLWLDATNPLSYPGSGTTWTDLSGNNRNGTLQGPLTYNATTKAIEFPGGVNGTAFVSLNANMNNFTTGMTIEFEGEFGAIRSTWERIFDFAFAMNQVAEVVWVGQFENTNELAIEIFKNGTGQGYCYTTTNGTALGNVNDRSFNKWLVTIDGTSPYKCRIYKNGTELRTRVTPFAGHNLDPSQANVNGSDYTLPSNTPRQSAFLGRSNFPQDRDLEGSIRYLRLYQQALTPAEVTANATSTVTFDANGGSGSMAPQTSVSSAALTPNAFTYSGFTFAGWNTAANGTGTAYANGATYPFSSSTTLYAQWTPDPTTTTTTTTVAPASVATTTTVSGATTTSLVNTASVATTTTTDVVSAESVTRASDQLAQAGTDLGWWTVLAVVLMSLGGALMVSGQVLKQRQ